MTDGMIVDVMMPQPTYSAEIYGTNELDIENWKNACSVMNGSLCLEAVFWRMGL